MYGNRCLTVKEREMVKTMYQNGGSPENIARYFESEESLIYNALPLKYFLKNNEQKLKSTQSKNS